jgi:hypothetical protein
VYWVVGVLVTFPHHSLQGGDRGRGRAAAVRCWSASVHVQSEGIAEVPLQQKTAHRDASSHLDDARI